MIDKKNTKKIIPKDPFFGYFLNNNQNRFQEKLLQGKMATFWHQLIARTFERNLYTYLQSNEKKSTNQVQLNGESFFNISSYDYLGLIGNAEIEKASIEAVKKYGTSTGGVRMLSGTNRLHEKLENKLASFKGTEAALTYSSGYMANLAVISCLVEKGDNVFVDEKIHKSMIDACYMAQVDFVKFKHNNAFDLRDKLLNTNNNGKCFIILEGIYSMDGSISKLPEFIELKEEFNCFLIVDEAHSFGVLGKFGRGLAEHYGIDPIKVDVWTSSLSKAIPANGGFIAGSRELIIFLQHHSSTFVFSSALNPGSVAAALKTIEIIEKSPEIIKKLWDNTYYFLNQARLYGVDTGLSESPITPIIAGSRSNTLKLSSFLFNRRILASGVIYPAVPLNEGRIRICMSSAYEKHQLDEVISFLSEYFNEHD